MRAEVNNTPMTEEDKEPIHERDSREEAEGKHTLTDDEFICFKEHDYIGNSPRSVLMHMRSAHGYKGGRARALYLIENESAIFRESNLPSVEDEHFEENNCEPAKERESNDEPTVFQKFLSAVSLGIYDPN